MRLTEGDAEEDGSGMANGRLRPIGR